MQQRPAPRQRPSLDARHADRRSRQPDVAPRNGDRLRGPRPRTRAGGDRAQRRAPRDRRARLRHPAQRRRRRGQGAPRGPHALRAVGRHPGGARGDRRRLHRDARRAGGPRSGRHHARREADHVLRDPRARRPGRRGRPARSELPDLPVDGGVRRRHRRAVRAAHRRRLPPRPGAPRGAHHPADEARDHQQPGQPDGQHAPARGPRAHRRGDHAPPRLHGAHRRGLPRAVVPRRAAGVDRRGRRDDGADDRARRPVRRRTR